MNSAINPGGQEIMPVTEENLVDLRSLCQKIHSTLKHEKRMEILELLDQNGPMTREEIMKAINDHMTFSHLNRLMAASFVARTKERPFLYSINDFLMRMMAVSFESSSLRAKKSTGIFVQQKKSGR